MKRNWLKWALCLALAAGLLVCVASAAIAQDDVAAASGATITVSTDGKLTVSASDLTDDAQYVLIQVKTNLTADSAEALLSAAQSATSPYTVSEDTILYIDQYAAANSAVTFSDFLPKSASTSLFILGGGEAPQIIGAMLGSGVTVSGTVTLKGAADTDTAAKVQILSGTEVVGEADVTVSSGEGTYSIETVPDGTYTLTVSGTSGKYVTREYEITVDGEEVTQNVELWTKGDVNGNGAVNVADYGKVLKHYQSSDAADKLSGYELKCADVSTDDVLNIKDYGKILAHYKGTESLW